MSGLQDGGKNIYSLPLYNTHWCPILELLFFVLVYYPFISTAKGQGTELPQPPVKLPEASYLKTGACVSQGVGLTEYKSGSPINSQ